MLENDYSFTTWICTNCGHVNNTNNNICNNCKSNPHQYNSPCTYCENRFTCKGGKHNNGNE